MRSRRGHRVFTDTEVCARFFSLETNAIGLKLNPESRLVSIRGPLLVFSNLTSQNYSFF